MIDHADMMLALYDGSKSGTETAVRVAKERNVAIYVVHPSVYFS